ncbi:MAG: hypothetical protein FJZ01_02525, partial [Candidatus Sericytochromatia bacterium]|nr:hypothetical protein [Candidatus Tanganyikabacteria bacterium]
MGDNDGIDALGDFFDEGPAAPPKAAPPQAKPAQPSLKPGGPGLQFPAPVRSGPPAGATAAA